MERAMFKKPVYLALFVLINLGFLLTAYEGQTQGVINLPQTGQSKCYDTSGTEISCAGTGQDGELQAGVEWPEPRFTVSGDCVTDNLTGLMWAKNGNLPNGTKTWQKALDYVASINSGSGLCGHKDWRLPNVNELESLINSDEASTANWLNSQGFSNVQSNNYCWSSTTITYNADNAWILTIWSGHVHDFSKSNDYYVWPVRSGQLNNPDPLYPANVWKTGQTTSYSSGDDGDLEKGVFWPVPRFTDHGNGTITDNLTGLMWTKNADLAGGTKFWQGALDYVKSINSGAGLGGYHDWRLPNRKELFSLIDHSKWVPALPASHPFQNVQSDYYWSSTTSAYSTDSAWFVYMWYGAVYASSKSGRNFVWPVRSGQGPLGYPDISVTPNPVEFGSVNVGATSEKQVIVKNDGNANLVIGTITSPTSPFSKATDNCSGQTIAPNATCTVMYRFAPTTSGNFSSRSNIPSNDPDENPVTISLNGVGVVETVSIPNILTGPITGTTGVSYSYTTGGSTSSLGHSVQYQFDWGDGTNSGWLPVGTTSASHPWSSAGNYPVKTQARCATDTSVLSSWSSSISVNIGAPITYPLTTSVNPSGAGIVTLNPAGGTYNAGTAVTLTATPNSGYTFSSWSGDLTGSTNPAQITMDGNKTVTAVFLLIKAEEDNPGITYTGTWNTYTSPSCSGGAMKYSGQEGAKAEFSFTGTGIKWIVTKATMMGKAKVYLDGGYMGLVDLYSSSPAFQVVLQKPGLAPGNHTLRLEVSGQKNLRATGYYINIDAFEVIP
jgi:hypothetical protein